MGKNRIRGEPEREIRKTAQRNQKVIRQQIELPLPTHIGIALVIAFVDKRRISGESRASP
jgi:hypothetical protein